MVRVSVCTFDADSDFEDDDDNDDDDNSSSGGKVSRFSAPKVTTTCHSIVNGFHFDERLEFTANYERAVTEGSGTHLVFEVLESLSE